VTLRNKIFDLVLNLNTLNNVKGDLARLQDKLKSNEQQPRQPIAVSSLQRDGAGFFGSSANIGNL